MRRSVIVGSPARKLAEFVQLSRRARPDRSGAILITGAGLSTASGIPDYRGPQGLYERGHRPMTFQKFTSGHDAQRRYWARSFLGYPTMCRRQCNSAHNACAALVRDGVVDHIITQNVDGLHGEAARQDTSSCRSVTHNDVSELHGNIHRTRCLACGHIGTRRELQHRLAEQNEELLARHPHVAAAGVLDEPQTASTSVLEMASESANSSQRAVPTGSVGLGQAQLRPDGDFEASQDWIDRFRIVPCAACGEYQLKPDMVFFGESTDPEVVRRCFDRVENAACVICVGTSMQVFSAYRFVVRAKAVGVPITVLNHGPTRSDKDAALKLEGQVEEVLPYVALRLAPRVDIS